MAHVEQPGVLRELAEFQERAAIEVTGVVFAPSGNILVITPGDRVPWESAATPTGAAARGYAEANAPRPQHVREWKNWVLLLRELAETYAQFSPKDSTLQFSSVVKSEDRGRHAAHLGVTDGVVETWHTVELTGPRARFRRVAADAAAAFTGRDREHVFAAVHSRR